MLHIFLKRLGDHDTGCSTAHGSSHTIKPNQIFNTCLPLAVAFIPAPLGSGHWRLLWFPFVKVHARVFKPPMPTESTASGELFPDELLPLILNPPTFRTSNAGIHAVCSVTSAAFETSIGTEKHMWFDETFPNKSCRGYKKG